MKILVSRLDHLGDLLLTTPLFRALKRAGHEVDVLARRNNLPVVVNNPHVAGHFAVEDISPEFPRGWGSLAAWMRRQSYDAILLPMAKDKELLWASACSGAGRRVAMWGGIWGRLTFHQCLRTGLLRVPRHASDVAMDCARALGVTPDGLAPDYFLTAEAEQWGQRVITGKFGSLKVVGIHPGCQGNTCNLPPVEYGRLAEHVLRRKDTAVVVTGVAADRGLLESWPAGVLSSNRCWNSMGELTVEQLAAVLKCMATFVVVGTGPLHLASCLRLTTVSPFCAYPQLSPVGWGNLGGKGVAVAPPLEYCLRHRRQTRKHCDFNGHVTAEKLFERVAMVLDGRS